MTIEAALPVVHSRGGCRVRVVGVDGCPGGWVAVEWDTERRTLTPTVYPSFADLLAANEGAERIGVDIPIGLAEGVPRGADRAARRMLGPRRSSVFSAPDPRLLGAETFAEAGERSRSLTGKGISIQAYSIFRKVAEVDLLMTPALQERVVEVHPEVSFTALGGRPMAHAKKRPEGYEERRALLSDALDIEMWTRAEARAIARPAGADDVLDAIVAAWSAYRTATGQAAQLPAEPEIDRRGLRMEIVY